MRTQHATHHAADRAKERYGIDPDAEAWRRAVLDIADVVAGVGRAALLMRRDGSTERWLVRVDGWLVSAQSGSRPTTVDRPR